MDNTTIGLSLWFFAKVAVLFGLLIYIIFTVVVIKQVNLMTATLELGHEREVKIISVLHLVFAVLVFLLALVIL